MRAALSVFAVFVLASVAFAQNPAADEAAVRTYLAQRKQAVTTAEASATFIREQLATLRGKLDYYADPKKSGVRSRADLKDHFGDLNDPVREAILRIYGLKEGLDALTSSFTGENQQTEPSLIRMLASDKYEYAGETLDWKTLKSRLNRAGSLNRYKAVKIVVSKADSPITLSRILTACQEAQIRSVYFDEQP